MTPKKAKELLDQLSDEGTKRCFEHCDEPDCECDVAARAQIFAREQMHSKAEETLTAYLAEHKARVKGEQERDAFKGNADDAYTKWVIERERANALQARVDRLEATLRVISMEPLVKEGFGLQLHADTVMKMARSTLAALADTGNKT